MASVAIVTDSTAYIEKKEREKLGVHIVPLSVIFGKEVFAEEIDIQVDEFYKKMASQEELPTTSQPAVGQFVELYTKLKEAGYKEVISIHISSKISGTSNCAYQAGQLVEGLDVHVFDSLYTCAPQAYFVEEAAALAKEGLDAKEIIEQLYKVRESISTYFMVDDLKHLHRGGRLGSGQLVVGQLLKIKPILRLEDGRIVPFEKVRTEKKAISRILTILEQSISTGGSYKVTVIHAMEEEKATEMAETIAERFPNVDVNVSYFGPVIGTHLGEGSLGVSWYKKLER